MATDFRAAFDFAAFWHGPMEEAVEAGDELAGGGGFDMFEKGRETADDFFLVQCFGNFAETLE